MLTKRQLIYVALPFLVALFPVLSLYQHNIHEVSFDALFSTVPQIIGATAVTFAIMAFTFRSLKEASHITSLAVLYYFSFGIFEIILAYAYLILGFFSISPVLAYRDEAILSIILYSGIYVFVSATILREQKRIQATCVGASLTAVAVMIFTILNVINVGFILRKEYAVRSLGSHYSHLSIESKSKKISPNEYPDIYYVILDRYARDDILKRDYGFSNTEFITFLQEKGFTVLHESRNNYPKTYVSVASSLNGQHLKDILPTKAMKLQDQTVVYEVLKDNWLLRLLKSRGYHTYHLGGWWGPTRFNKYSDVNVSLYAGSTEFLYLLLNTSINKAMRASVTGTRYRNSLLSYPEPSGYDNFMYQTDFMAQLARNPEKSFAFMHSLSIHEPYFFNDGCGQGGVSYTESYEVYLRQLKCTNMRLTEMVNTILSESVDPVIIILQSDEGPITYDMDDNNWVSNSPAQLQRHLRIFNAIYSTSPLSVYEGMTPVNTFRIIGREVFGLDLQNVPDTSYAYKSHKAPLTFTDVTDIVVGERPVRFIAQ